MGGGADPWATFEDCRFRADVGRALRGLGFAAPTYIQSCCWPLIMGGRDVVGVAETGSGKTLAFLVPAFDQHHKARTPAGAGPPRRGVASPAILVLAPTRELALQIEREAQRLGAALGISSCCLYGGVDFKLQIATLRQHPDLVVACPGRLIDLVNRRHICLSGVGFFTLDEADRMLDMGFSEEVQKIISWLPRERQTVMFTATWPEDIQRIAGAYTRNPCRVQQDSAGELTCNRRVSQEVRLCRSQVEKVHALVEFLKGLEPESRVIVFVNTKAVISSICQDLRRAGLQSVALHADLDQQDRERSLDDFRSGRCFLAVATDVASRGLDVRDVRAVVCFDTVRDRATHVHRIGRTGRAGASGRALTLIMADSHLDLRMAKQILEFMRDAQQAVSPELEASIEASLRQERCAVQDGGTALLLPDSSDDEVGEAADTTPGGAPWVPWDRRPCVFCDPGLARPHLLAQALGSAQAPAEGAGKPGGSGIGSVLSGSSSLQNPVEDIFGHAASRDISVSICQETVRSGCRLVTHDYAGTGLKGSRKPFRWAVLRRVPWQEIMLASTHKAFVNLEASPDFVWHVVVHELRKTRAGKVLIATNYFKSNISMVYDYLTEAFQLLDDDDPEVIRAATSNESILTVLRMYFETGDTQNPKHYHTMSKLCLWSTGTLLHHCCESGFSKCVEYLLNHHTPQTAPRDKPWLQLADPCWLDKTWRNSAFHSAAWTGQAAVAAVLVKWAVDHAQVSKVRYLFDKKKQTPMDLVEARLKKVQGRGVDDTRYRATFNALAQVFGKRVYRGIDEHLLSADQPDLCGSLVITDHEDCRRSVPLPAGELTLEVLLVVLQQEREALLSTRVDTLLLSRLDLKSRGSPEADRHSAEQLVSLVCLCRRIAFVNCTAPPALATCVCVSVSRQLRRTRDGCHVAWHSLSFPSWTEIPARGSEEFAEALWDLSAAIRGTSSNHALQTIHLAPGTATGYLPESQRHLPLVLSATMALRSLAHLMLGSSPDDWKHTELCKMIGASAEKFTCHNPLLKLPDALERKLLDRGSLSIAEDVCGCLSPGWQDLVEATADCLVSATLTMPDWAPLVVGRPVEEGEEGLKIMRKMADEALLHLLKMRRSRSRSGGLPHLAKLVGPYLRGRHLERCFPQTLEYFRRKFRSFALPP